MACACSQYPFHSAALSTFVSGNSRNTVQPATPEMIDPPSTPIFTASDNSGEPAKASPPMNRLMVTPMPRQGHAMELGHGGAVRLVGIPEPHRRPSRPEHADPVADDQP